MRLDEREPKLGWRAIDRGCHGVEQWRDPGKGPVRCGLFGDPRRIFEDIAQCGDEVGLAVGV